MPDAGGWGSLQSDWTFLRRLLITLVALGLAYFTWLISGVLLLAFAAILLATLLHGLSDAIARLTSLPDRWSLLVAVLVIGALLAGFTVLFGTQTRVQIANVLTRLPDAIDAVGQRVGVENATDRLEEVIGSGPGGVLLSRVAGLGYTVVGAIANVVLVLVAAVYLAADPGLYRRGVVKLFPPSQHGHVLNAMNATGRALRLWFAGQIVSMALVGTLCGLAFWWIGLPSAFALGIIAGATNFIPFLGPILGSIPAVIFAFGAGLATVLWTIAAITVIQQVEGYVIMPLVQRWAVSLPPALALFAIVAAGLVFGLPGVLFAVPIAVAAMVVVKQLWVREMLGEETDVPGDDDPPGDA